MLYTNINKVCNDCFSLVSACKPIYATNCCCSYRPLYAEGVFCLFIEIILGLLPFERLQMLFSFVCLSFSCPGSFRDPNYVTLKIQLLNKNAATPMCFIASPHYSGVSEGNHLRVFKGKHFLTAAAHLYNIGLYLCKEHSYISAETQRKTSLPLEVIFPGRK